MKKSYVYILKCADQTYYTGITSNLTKRIFEHESGKHKDSYTSTRRPIELVFYGEFTDINTAIEKEKQVKKWSRTKKEALINGNFEDLPNLAKKKFD
jgi:putative endonuclease